MLYLADVSAAIHVRPRQLLDYQMSNIPLPTNEAQFSWRGGSRNSVETHEMAFGVDALNLPASAIPHADISELGQLIRSVSLATLKLKLCELTCRSVPYRRRSFIKSWRFSDKRHMIGCRHRSVPLRSSLNFE